MTSSKHIALHLLQQNTHRSTIQCKWFVFSSNLTLKVKKKTSKRNTAINERFAHNRVNCIELKPVCDTRIILRPVFIANAVWLPQTDIVSLARYASWMRKMKPYSHNLASDSKMCAKYWTGCGCFRIVLWLSLRRPLRVIHWCLFTYLNLFTKQINSTEKFSIYTKVKLEIERKNHSKVFGVWLYDCMIICLSVWFIWMEQVFGLSKFIEMKKKRQSL